MGLPQALKLNPYYGYCLMSNKTYLLTYSVCPVAYIQLLQPHCWHCLSRRVRDVNAWYRHFFANIVVIKFNSAWSVDIADAVARRLRRRRRRRRRQKCVVDRQWHRNSSYTDSVTWPTVLIVHCIFILWRPLTSTVQHGLFYGEFNDTHGVIFPPSLPSLPFPPLTTVNHPNFYILRRLSHFPSFDNLYSIYNGSKREKEKKKNLN